MKSVSRRQFNTLLALGSATLMSPVALRGQSKPKVVIIGGGAGGATAARYLATDSDGRLDITLIEESPKYTTCFYSNLYLGDVLDFESITFDYKTLASDYGVNVVNGFAQTVDAQARQVSLRDGTKLDYDRLLVAPGMFTDTAAQTEARRFAGWSEHHHGSTAQPLSLPAWAL